MTLLDDDIDDLLRTFRLDEAVLDDAARDRMWSRICAEVPDAREGLDAIGPSPGVRALHPRRGRSPRLLAAAAAVLVLLAVGGVVLRSGGSEDPVTADDPTSTTTEAPAFDLRTVAAEVEARPVTVLGSAGDARYTHQVVERTVGTAASDPSMLTEERWVAADGSGRLVVVVPDGPRRDEELDEPGAYTLGLLRPEVALALPADAAGVLAAIEAQEGTAVVPGDVSRNLLQTLTFAGLPAPARAGILRLLHDWGFGPVTAPGLAPSVGRVEGPGPDGSVVQADIDLSTGQVVATRLSGARGYLDVRAVIEADLRADTQGP